MAMTTTTYGSGPSRPEIELLLRAAAGAASPVEHGREQARRATGRLLTGLTVCAASVACYDLGLLLGGAQ